MKQTVGGDELAFRVTAQESAGALTAVDVRLPPGGGPPMLHRHDPYELYRVESGKLTFYRDDGEDIQRSVAEAGDVVAIPGGTEHTIRNESEHEAKAYVVFVPGGEMERFSRAAADLAASGPIDPADVISLAAEHGIEITRPI